MPLAVNPRFVLSLCPIIPASKPKQTSVLAAIGSAAGHCGLLGTNECAGEFTIHIREEGFDVKAAGGKQGLNFLAPINSRRFNSDLLKTGIPKPVPVFLVVQGPGDASGPKLHVPPDLRRDILQHHDI